MNLKKLLVISIVFVLCMSVCVVAFAAPSPTGGSATATDAAGNPVVLTIKPVANEATLKSQVDVAKAPGTVAFLQDISAPAGYSGGAITLTLDVAGVKAGDTVTVIHYVNGAWQYITPSSVKDGKVTVTLSSLSPVGVVVKAADPVATETTDTTATSPKTGSADYMGILAIIALAVTCGIVMTCKTIKRSEG